MMEARKSPWTDDEIQRLIDWCKWWRSESAVNAYRTESRAPRTLAKQHAVDQLMRVVAMHAGQSEDPKWAPFLLEHADWVQGEESLALARITQHAVEALLAAGAPVSKGVLRLSKVRSPSVRYGVASGLRVEDPKALPVLEKLAKDDNVQVRKRAKEKLSQVKELPWWFGVFQSDPLLGLEPDAAERIGLPLQTVVGYLEASVSKDDAENKKFVAACAELPDGAASDVVLKLLAREPYNPVAGELFRDFVEREAAPALLYDFLAACICTREDEEGKRQTMHLFMSDWLSGVSDGKRSGLVLDWLGRKWHEPADETLHGEDSAEVDSAVEWVISRAWPKHADTRPLWDLFLRAKPKPLEAGGCHWNDLSATVLRLVAQDKGMVRSEFWHVLEVVEKYGQTSALLRNIVENLDAAQRQAYMEKYKDSPDRRFRNLAVELSLLGAGENDSGLASEQAEERKSTSTDTEQTDAATRTQQLVQSWKDLAFRQHLFRTPKLMDFFMGPLRSFLVTGQLSLTEAGGLLGKLGDKAEPQEWAAYRAQQDAVLVAKDPVKYVELLSAFQPGALHPEDLEIAERSYQLAGTWLSSPTEEQKSAVGKLACRLVLVFSLSSDTAVRKPLEQWLELAIENARHHRFRCVSAYQRYCSNLGLEPKGDILPEEDDFDDDFD